MRLISNQIIPHFNFSDSLHALLQIFSWKKHNFDFQKFFKTPNFRLTNAARSALGIIAQSLPFSPTKRIGIPAFICGVVATPFIQAGYSIEWIDTDENGLIDPQDFEKKSKNIGLVIVPHIFGQKAPIERIHAIAQKKNILVLEDNAHFPQALDSPQDFKYSDLKIFSFGREKVMSCVSGGALVWKSSLEFGEKLEKFPLPSSPFWWTFRHLSQPFIFSLGINWWHWGGKMIPAFFAFILWLPKAVSQKEKNGQEDFPICGLSLPQQKVLIRQIALYPERQKQGKEKANLWYQELKSFILPKNIIIPPSGFRTILTGVDRKKWISQARKINLDLSEWNGIPLSPEGIYKDAFGYKCCPKAEKYAQEYLTLPTHTNLKKHYIKGFAQKLKKTRIEQHG